MKNLLQKINQNGFNPIATAELDGEPVFIFKTKEEAIDCHSVLGDGIDAYWYSEEEFSEINSEEQVAVTLV